MKLAIFFICLGCALVFGKPFEASVIDGDRGEELQTLEITPEVTVAKVNLKEVWDRFIGLIDTHKLTKLLVEKLTVDSGAQALSRYLRSEKVKTIVSHIRNDPEYIKFVRWLYENGFTNIYTSINWTYAFFGWDSKSTTSATAMVVDKVFAKSMQTLAGDFLEALPLNDMGELALELAASEDPAIKALLGRLREPGMGEAWRRLKVLPEMQELIEALMEGTFALEIYLLVLEAFLGW